MHVKHLPTVFPVWTYWEQVKNSPKHSSRDFSCFCFVIWLSMHAWMYISKQKWTFLLFQLPIVNSISWSTFWNSRISVNTWWNLNCVRKRDIGRFNHSKNLALFSITMKTTVTKNRRTFFYDLHCGNRTHSMRQSKKATKCPPRIMVDIFHFYDLDLDFRFCHFFSHIAAKSWLASCNWWWKPSIRPKPPPNPRSHISWRT